jgi:hypothetical protein
MMRLVAIGAVLVSVLGSSVVAGRWTGRWGHSEEIKRAVARLDLVPPTLGEEWDVHPQTLSDREVRLGEIDGYLYRRCVHRKTGAVVSVMLLCGRPSPISVHTPEVCYAGAGYAPLSEKRAHSVGDAGFQFQDFVKSDVTDPHRLRVFMSWGHGGQWSVPRDPRFTFGWKSHLYKLYVVRELTSEESPEQDVAVALIKDLLPQLKEALFTDPGKQRNRSE